MATKNVGDVFKGLHLLLKNPHPQRNDPRFTRNTKENSESQGQSEIPRTQGGTFSCNERQSEIPRTQGGTFTRSYVLKQRRTSSRGAPLLRKSCAPCILCLGNVAGNKLKQCLVSVYASLPRVGLN